MVFSFFLAEYTDIAVYLYKPSLQPFTDKGIEIGLFVWKDIESYKFFLITRLLHGLEMILADSSLADG